MKFGSLMEVGDSFANSNLMGAVDKKRMEVGVETMVNSVHDKIVHVIASAEEIESKDLPNSNLQEDDHMDVDSIELESGCLIGPVGEERPPKQDDVNLMNSVDENVLPKDDGSLDSVRNSVGDNMVNSGDDEQRLQENDHPMDAVTSTEGKVDKLMSPGGDERGEADNMVNSGDEERLQKSDEQRLQENDHPTDSVTSTEEKVDKSTIPGGEQRPLDNDVPMDSITSIDGKADNLASPVGEQRPQENDDPMDSIASTEGKVDNLMSPLGEQRPQENDDPMDSITSTEGKVDNLTSPIGEQRPQENGDPMDSITSTEGKASLQNNVSMVTTTEGKSEHHTNSVGEPRPGEGRPQNNDVLADPVSIAGAESGNLILVGDKGSRENTEVRSAVSKGGENLTTSVGEKRASEISVADVLRQNKKARVNTRGDMKRVAEMVLVLSAVGNMRGGRSPTAAEKEIMAEAREKLVGLCEGIAPKDILTRDAVRVVIEDLGLNRTKDQRLCFRPPTMSIKEKLQLSKTKMEESKKFGIQSGKYSSQPLQGGSGAKESNGGFVNGIQKFPQDKSSHVAVSGVPDTSSSTNHANEMQSTRGAFNNSMERDASSLPTARSEPMHFRLDGKSNVSTYAPQIRANATGDHLAGKMPNYSAQPQQGAVPRVGFANKVPDHKLEGKPVMGASQIDRSISHSTSQPAYGSTQAVQKPLHGLNYVQAPSAHSSTHNEIAKTVQKFLHPRAPEHPSWTPPSTDYMNKSLTCQACKASVNDTETVLVCDACEKGHHLKCLQSYNQKLIPKGEWHCPNCLIASNGKPLPPKYGRVTRNSSTPKVASNAAAPPTQKVESSLDQKPNHHHHHHHQKVTANGDPGGSLRAAGNIHTPSTTALKMSNSKEASGNRLKMEDVHLSDSKNNTVSASCPKPTNESSKPVGLAPKPPPNCGETAVSSLLHNAFPSKSSDQSNSKVVDSRDNCEVRKDGQDGATQTGNGGLKSSSSVDGVDWMGERVQVVEEKEYYNSCCINGMVYQLQDHALFRSSNGNLRPSKLQSMWEDTKTGTKWANVNSCYLPADLPEVVGRPCSPENNEVYESNHDSTVRAGSIQGPCEVLPPNKFMQESERRRIHSNDVSHPIFLCKWFYDEMKGLFRPVTD